MATGNRQQSTSFLGSKNDLVMGIKGLYSLLQSEPSRFGKSWSWSSRNSHGKGLHVFIDGPALHHHLVSSWVEEIRKNDSTLCHISSASIDNIPYNTRSRPKLPVDAPAWSNELAYVSSSPCSTVVLYELTYSFLHTLFLTGIQQVHVVWDGLTHGSKRRTQIQRFETQCYQSYQNAQHFIMNDFCGSKDKLPQPTCHLWGECIMQEAICNLQETLENEEFGQRDRSLWNHFAENEADIYLGHFFFNQKKQDTNYCFDDEYIVLSNDTDLFVYSSIPGFIPLSTLMFEIASCTGPAHMRNSSVMEYDYAVKGWIFTQHQFHSAFPYVLYTPTRIATVCHLPMIIIAALAGCDYTLDPILQQALYEVRHVLVKSDGGGLRLRDRNDPSCKKSLIAIFRCLGNILQNMVSAFESLLAKEFLTVVGNALVDHYTDPRRKNNRHHQQQQHMKGIEIHEGTKISFVHALIEISGIYNETSCLIKPLRKRSINQLISPDVTLRRILKHRVFYCKPLIEIHHIHGQSHNHSVWADPTFSSCRARLYAVLAYICKECSVYDSVDDYVHRIQGSRHVFQYVPVPIADWISLLKSHSTGEQNMPFIEMIGFILGSPASERLQITTMSIPMNACFLLTSFKAKLLLFTASFISTLFPDYRHFIKRFHPLDLPTSTHYKTHFLDAYNYLQVALIHTKLAYGIFALSASPLDESLNHFDRFLLDETLLWSVWRRMEEENSHYTRNNWDFKDLSPEYPLKIIEVTVDVSTVDYFHIRMKLCQQWKLWFEH